MQKNRCREVIRNLYRILDEGGQSDNLCIGILEHLKDCSACANRYRELEILKSLCRKFPASGMSEEQKEKMKKDLKNALLRNGSG